MLVMEWQLHAHLCQSVLKWRRCSAGDANPGPLIPMPQAMHVAPASAQAAAAAAAAAADAAATDDVDAPPPPPPVAAAFAAFPAAAADVLAAAAGAPCSCTPPLGWLLRWRRVHRGERRAAGAGCMHVRLVGAATQNACATCCARRTWRPPLPARRPRPPGLCHRAATPVGSTGSQWAPTLGPQPGGLAFGLLQSDLWTARVSPRLLHFTVGGGYSFSLLGHQQNETRALLRTLAFDLSNWHPPRSVASVPWCRPCR